jgi:hypothetical protein
MWKPSAISSATAAAPRKKNRSPLFSRPLVDGDEPGRAVLPVACGAGVPGGREGVFMAYLAG